jgi:hypothetical protein
VVEHRSIVASTEEGQNPLSLAEMNAYLPQSSRRQRNPARLPDTLSRLSHSGSAFVSRAIRKVLAGFRAALYKRLRPRVCYGRTGKWKRRLISNNPLIGEGGVAKSNPAPSIRASTPNSATCSGRLIGVRNSGSRL